MAICCHTGGDAAPAVGVGLFALVHDFQKQAVGAVRGKMPGERIPQICKIFHAVCTLQQRGLVAVSVVPPTAVNAAVVLARWRIGTVSWSLAALSRVEFGFRRIIDPGRAYSHRTGGACGSTPVSAA